MWYLVDMNETEEVIFDPGSEYQLCARMAEHDGGPCVEVQWMRSGRGLHHALWVHAEHAAETFRRLAEYAEKHALGR